MDQGCTHVWGLLLSNAEWVFSQHAMPKLKWLVPPRLQKQLSTHSIFSHLMSCSSFQVMFAQVLHQHWKKSPHRAVCSGDYTKTVRTCFTGVMLWQEKAHWSFQVTAVVASLLWCFTDATDGAEPSLKKLVSLWLYLSDMGSECLPLKMNVSEVNMEIPEQKCFYFYYSLT